MTWRHVCTIACEMLEFLFLVVLLTLVGVGLDAVWSLP